jgi:hypothetical protein
MISSSLRFLQQYCLLYLGFEGKIDYRSFRVIRENTDTLGNETGPAGYFYFCIDFPFFAWFQMA